MRRNIFSPKSTQLIVLIFFVGFLVSQAYVGHFSRYLADDYCTATVVLKEGLINSIRDWHFNWTGRYTFNTLIGIVSLIGVKTVSWMPVIVITSWFGALMWMLYQAAMALRVQAPLRSAGLFAGLILYATFSGTTSITQSLYWAGGTLLYTVPLIFLTLNIGLFIFRLRQVSDNVSSPVYILLTCLITFTAGGLSEVYVILQLGVLGLITLGLTFFGSATLRKRATPLLVSGLICSVLALLIMITAPGNAIRRPNFGDPLPFPENILQIVKVSFAMMATAIAIHAPIELLVVLILSVFFVTQFMQFDSPIPMSRQRVRILLGLSVVIAVGLTIACVAPPVYLYPVAPPDRMHIIPHLILVCTTVFVGCVIGLDIKQKSVVKLTHDPVSFRNMAILGILLLIGPIRSTGRVLEQIPAFETFATEWDIRDQEIRAAADSGIQDLSVNYLSVDIAGMAGLDIIGPDPLTWMNVCVASYYNIKSIRSAESST